MAPDESPPIAPSETKSPFRVAAPPHTTVHPPCLLRSLSQGFAHAPTTRLSLRLVENLRRPQEAVFPFTPADGLSIKANTAFYAVLPTVAPLGHTLCPKIRLANSIKVKNAYDKSAFNRAHNPIAGKHIDFLLCTSPNLKTVLAIELDDSTHTRPDRKARDTFINAALAAAGIPVLHVRWERGYDREQLRRDIQGILRPPPMPKN